jgi:predicted PurR-regulated permease PerM
MSDGIARSKPVRLGLTPGVLALALLAIGCVVVLKPFFSALMWAMILAYVLYPLQRRFTRWFRGSPTVAACFVSLTITLVIAGPIVLIGFSIAEDGRQLGKATRDWFMEAPEAPPQWVQTLPVVGNDITEVWTAAAVDRDRWMGHLDHAVRKAPVTNPDDGEAVVEAGEEEATAESPRLVELLGKFLSWARSGLVKSGIAIGSGVVQMVMSAFLTFFLLRDAPVLAERLGMVVERLAGARGRHLLKVAGDTVHGVIYGMLGTALIQAVVAGIGFAIAGVPGAILLSVLVFFFAVIPFGPPIVWLPAALWLFAQGSPGWGIFMLIWGALCISSVDNILRPFLISQGTRMPFILVFCGLVGGALAFGLVGVFLGPVLLAVGFRLMDEWTTRESPLAPAAEPS